MFRDAIIIQRVRCSENDYGPSTAAMPKRHSIKCYSSVRSSTSAFRSKYNVISKKYLTPRTQSIYINTYHRKSISLQLYLLLLIVLLGLFNFETINANINELSVHNAKLAWIIGRWRSEFSGKIVWPTVPTMTYGEELIIELAPQAKTTKAQFFNYSDSDFFKFCNAPDVYQTNIISAYSYRARAWSHSTKDHFHDEWGFMTVDANGNATLMTTGNNGFTTYEVGKVETNKLVLTLKDIGRISFSRDLPVEDLRRTFIRHDDTYLEQILEMRTATHPKSGYLEHTRVIYSKIKDNVQKAKSSGDTGKST